MAYGGDIRAGKAFVEVYLKNRALMRGLANTQRRLRDFGTSATMIGRQAMMASGAMLLPVVAGTKVFADFEHKMALIATMLDEPEKHVDGFSSSLSRLSQISGKATGDLADGLYDILSATIAPEKAMGVLEAATRLAVGGNADVKDSTAALLTLMETYGDRFHDAGDGADFLFQIVRRGRTNLAELAPEIGRILSTAQSAGLSLEDLGASMALLTRATGKTEIATTALNAITTAFLKPTAEGAALWSEKYGSAFDYATLKTEGMLGVLQKLSQMNPAEIAEIFPNVRALRGILPALKKMSGFQDDIDAMKNRAGAVDKAYEEMAKTVSHAYNQIVQAAQAAGRAVGKAIGPIFVEWGKHAKTALTIIASLLEANLRLVRTFTAIAAGVGIAGAVLVGVGSAALVASVAVGGIATVFGSLVPLIGAILSPVGLAIAAVAGLGGYLVYASDAGGKALGWLGEQFSDLFRVASNTWKAITNAIAAGDIEAAVKVVTSSIKLAWLEAKISVTETWQGFRVFWSDLTTWLASAMIETVAVIKTAWAGLIGAFTGMWETWKASFSTEWIAQRILDVAELLPSRIRTEIGLDFDIAEIRKTLAEDMSRRRDALPGKLDTIDAATRADQNKSEADRKAAQVALQEDKNTSDLAAGKAIAAAKKELADARKARDEAIKNAGKLAPNGGGSGGPGGPGGAPAPTPFAAPNLAAMAGAIKGTFSASAVAGMGMGGPAERTAKAVERIARQNLETMKIDREMLREQKRMTLEATA